MMSFIQQFYLDCLVKFALMGHIPLTPLCAQKIKKYPAGIFDFFTRISPATEQKIM